MEIDVGSAIEVVEREMFKRVAQREKSTNDINKYIAGVVAEEQLKHIINREIDSKYTQERLKHIIKREIDNKYMQGD